MSKAKRLAKAKAQYPKIGRRLEELEGMTKSQLWDKSECYQPRVVASRDAYHRKAWLVDDIMRAEFNGKRLDDFWNIAAGY